MTSRNADQATLFAPITAPGKASIAAVRLSGPRALEVAARVAPPLPTPRRAALRRIRCPDGGALIDEGLVVVFPAPESFTGEDVVEFHLHGGSQPTRSLMTALTTFEGLVAAAPGAFSRRALLNGRLDLTRLEAIADLIDAETEAQATQALRQLDGALGLKVAAWQGRLTALRAHLEAGLDFADESDVAERDTDDDGDLIGLRADIAAVLADDRGERLRDGVRVVLTGPPNAGKSSLLNALAGRDAAIVTAIPGTTRDLLEVRLEIDGRPLTLVDTAGLRPTADPIEAEGVRRAEEAGRGADLRVVLVDGCDWRSGIDAGCAAAGSLDIVVVTKADLVGHPPRCWAGHDIVAASVVAVGGLEQLMRVLRSRLEATFGAAGDPFWTRARHRQALVKVIDELDAAGRTFDPVLRAESLRLAQRELGTVTGEGVSASVLDAIFASFCIGK